MADNMRQRSVKEELKSDETKARRAQSILIYGEQRARRPPPSTPSPRPPTRRRYEYAKDVPYKTQMAANYAWIGWCGMLGVLARLALEAVTAGKGFTLGTTGALYVNLLGCFLYGVWARSYVAKNMPALYTGLTVGFCGCLTTFSSWAVNAAEHFCRGNAARGVATLIFPLWIFLGGLELGLFAGDAIEAECTNAASLEKLEPGDVKLKAPDEARLPFYHNYKLLIGWVLFVLILLTALLVVGLSNVYVEEAAAVAMAPLGAWLRYHLSSFSKGKNYPYGTLCANFAATAIAAMATGLWTKTKGSDIFWHAVVDGFCGALSTASTFTYEFRMLKEAPHAPRGYVYAAMMLLAGQVAAIPFVASIPSM